MKSFEKELNYTRARNGNTTRNGHNSSYNRTKKKNKLIQRELSKMTGDCIYWYKYNQWEFISTCWWI